jgi:hypothetical protein
MELVQVIRQYKVRFDVISNRLPEVWRAVEWWDSLDSGEDSLKQEIESYRQDYSRAEPSCV